MKKSFLTIQKKLNHKLLEKNQLYKQSVDSYNISLIADFFMSNHKTVVVVTPNLYEAQRYYDALSQVVDKEACLFYPSDQVLTSWMALSSSEFRQERLFTLNQLLRGKPYIVVTNMQGLLLKQLSPQDYRQATLTLRKGETFKQEHLINYLINGGFQFEYIVETPGSFSKRGHIVDIYTNYYPNPIRIDFFGDEIDSIKWFDIATQRSIEYIDSIDLMPSNELFYTKEMFLSAKKRISKHFLNVPLSIKEEQKLTADLEALEERKQLHMLNYYIQFFTDKIYTLLDFVEDKRVIAIDPYKMDINLEQTKDDQKSYALAMEGDHFLKFDMFDDYEHQKKRFDVEIDNLGFNNDKAISLGVFEVDVHQGNLEHFYLTYQQESYQQAIIMAIKDEHQVKTLIDFFKTKPLPLKTKMDQTGFILLDDDYVGSYHKAGEYVILNQETIFGHKTSKAISYRSVLNQTQKIREIEELTAGDYVVHYEYGIGRYIGLKTMTLSSHIRDYLQIVYLNDDVLYVPVDQIDYVLKYNSQDGKPPKLSKMGGKQWQKAKAQTKQKIKDLSDKLLSLYAKRKQSDGFAFEKDEAMQKQFENDFLYALTKDQEKAIVQTKFDMEQAYPMDRLILGDVGFGKTEVALRAAFKAVMSLKQVMYLVPTTVLARQHYYTFKNRFDKYGANVALLSRFVSKKEQSVIIEKLKKGLIDVVIGTHRLLSKDIVYKDLGLLIIDEEQRFGVIHKEMIKEIKVNVDSLTLSATPIPRTLQMSLLGLKEVSMIETPPQNRYPVQTYVIEKQDGIVREAIMRELARGGQVYYLYNRVMGIEFVVNRLKTLVPEAKIGYAHGKMNKDALEAIIEDFTDHHYDVLVSTTIIETGVDIPNTNTLIIEDADKLGLSQLYQIRGRVGRSDRIAYAYLMYQGFEQMNEEAKKRLTAIKDFTALGSGYKIALRDLAIRGAGDILGSEQSGFIDSVGIELYMKLLEEEMTGKPFLQPIQAEDEVYAKRHIDPKYIEEDHIRLEIHKRIHQLDSLLEVEQFKDELTDRFGEFDYDLVIYMYEKLAKKLGYFMGVEKIKPLKDTITIVFNPEHTKHMDGLALFELSSRYWLPFSISYLNERISIKMDIANQTAHWLYLLCRFLEDYQKTVREDEK